MKYLPILILVTACGTEPTKTSSEPAKLSKSTSFEVADDAALGPCDASREGWIAYVTATKTLKACSTGLWTTIALPAGPAGKDGVGVAGVKGSPGDTGAPGVQGMPGATNKVADFYTCSGALNADIEMTYDATVMTSGDVFVRVTATLASVDYGDSNYFGAFQVGARTGGILFTMGPNNSYMNVSLDRTTMMLTALYDLSGTETTHHLSGAQCRMVGP